jgi:hypothetical protein
VLAAVLAASATISFVSSSEKTRHTSLWISDEGSAVEVSRSIRPSPASVRRASVEDSRALCAA